MRTPTKIDGNPFLLNGEIACVVQSFRSRNQIFHTSSIMSKSKQFINLIVGGLHFCLSSRDIKEFPDSYFAHLLKDEWNADKSKVVTLDRDGEAFRYIHYYMLTGYMDTERQSIVDVQTLIAVKIEADFYNLPYLVSRCNARMRDFHEDFCYLTVPKIAPFELYDCVTECELAPMDALVAAMLPLRKPCIATARLTTYNDDQTYFYDIKELLSNQKSATPSFRKASSVSRRCPKVQLTIESLSYGTWRTIKDSFSEWPFTPRKNFGVNDGTVFVLYKGQSFKNITQDVRSKVLGVIVYIFGSDFTGGEVSATVNGQTVLISQPGECMALQAGVMYSVGKVTSGVLILVELAADIRQSSWGRKADGVEWLVHQPENYINTASESAESAIYNNISSSVKASLEEYSSVVLCLTRYYPIRIPDEPSRCCETDPDNLCLTDAALRAVLMEQFDVSVVSVYISRVDHGQRVLNACVVDFLVEEAVDSSANATVCKSEKCNIVSPLFGCGEKYSCNVPVASGCTGTRTEELSTVDAWCTLLTGLLMTKKHQK